MCLDRLTINAFVFLNLRKLESQPLRPTSYLCDFLLSVLNLFYYLIIKIIKMLTIHYTLCLFCLFQIIADGVKGQDLTEVAKLFNIYKE